MQWAKTLLLASSRQTDGGWRFRTSISSAATPTGRPRRNPFPAVGMTRLTTTAVRSTCPSSPTSRLSRSSRERTVWGPFSTRRTGGSTISVSPKRWTAVLACGSRRRGIRSKGRACRPRTRFRMRSPVRRAVRRSPTRPSRRNSRVAHLLCARSISHRLSRPGVSPVTRRRRRTSRSRRGWMARSGRSSGVRLPTSTRSTS